MLVPSFLSLWKPSPTVVLHWGPRKWRKTVVSEFEEPKIEELVLY